MHQICKETQTKHIRKGTRKKLHTVGYLSTGISNLIFFLTVRPEELPCDPIQPWTGEDCNNANLCILQFNMLLNKHEKKGKWWFVNCYCRPIKQLGYIIEQYQNAIYLGTYQFSMQYKLRPAEEQTKKKQWLGIRKVFMPWSYAVGISIQQI